MTLAQLQAAIQAKGYGTDTAATQIVAINSAYHQILGLHRWPFLEKNDATTLVTVVGQSAYTLTGVTDFRQIDAVRISSSNLDTPEITYEEPQSFRDYAHADRDNDVPRIWTFIDGQIKLWPFPSTIYTITIDYVKTTPDLASGSDTPIFDPVFHDVIVWGAVKEMAYRERDWNARNAATAEYEQRLGQMERTYGIRQKQTSSHVAHAPWWNYVGMQ